MTTASQTPGSWELDYPLHVERGSIDDEPEGVDLNTHVSSWAVVDDSGNWVAQGIPTRELAERFAAAPAMLSALCEARDQLEQFVASDKEGRDTDARKALREVRKAIAEATKGGTRT
jgi:hypothetical protein